MSVSKKIYHKAVRILSSVPTIPHKTYMAFYRRRKPWTIEGKYGLVYKIDPHSVLEFHIERFGIYNDWIATHLGGFIPPDGIVFDIGASTGLLTVPFAKVHVPLGKVFAFEPEDTSRAILEENIKINNLKNVVVSPYALQDNPKEKSVSFTVRETLDGDGLLNKGLSTIEKIHKFSVKTVTIPATTVDEEVKKWKLDRVDFIKIDVEGAEDKVLRGAKETIRKYMPIIQYEYSTTIEQLAKSSYAQESFRLLQTYGYVQFELVEESTLVLLREPKNIPGSNILCFPKEKVPDTIQQNEINKHNPDMDKLHLDRCMGMFMLGDTEEKVVSLFHMREADQKDIALLPKAIMNIQQGEKVYVGEEFDYITPFMRPFIATRNGKVSMITAYRKFKQKRSIDSVFDSAVTYYTYYVGKPTKQKVNQVVWEMPNIKIVVGKRSMLYGLAGHAVYIVLSCADPNKLPQSRVKCDDFSWDLYPTF